MTAGPPTAHYVPAADGFLATDPTIGPRDPARSPAGERLVVDAATQPGPAGAGPRFGDLYDATGRIGRSSPALFVAPR